MKIQIKIKHIVILQSGSDHLGHYLLKENGTGNGPFGTQLWTESYLTSAEAV